MKLITIKRSIAAIVLCSLALGQGSRMGTASSTQLKITQGARYLSGGGAAASAVGMDAVYWNPAGLALSGNKVDAIFSNRKYIGDIDNNFFGVATMLGGIGKVGITVRTFNFGDIPETTVWDPDGTGRIFTPNYIILGATVSKPLSDKTSVGVTANLIREGFGRVSASGMSFDVGVQYKNLVDIEGLNIGFVLKNFGRPLEYTGEGLGLIATAQGASRPREYYKVDAAEFQLPFTFDMAMSYSLSAINIGATYESNYYGTDAVKAFGSFDFGIGSVQAGYQTSMAEKDDPDGGDWDYENTFDGITFGATLNMSSFVGMNVSLDYALFPTTVFDSNQVIALRFGF